jgi:predicted anti-sigma-YlaC factor YlaD
MRSVVCERARAQVSLELDGELSQLEARMLSAHLARCGECSGYAEGVRSLTRALREAPLESPATPVVAQRARRSTFGRLHVSATAALAIVAVSVASQVALTSPEGRALEESPAISQHFQTRVELEQELAIIELVRTRTATSSSATML